MSTPIMDIPVSLIVNGPLSLPLQDEPLIHDHATIPFSLLVKDFDPNTAKIPSWEEPRCWLANRLLGPRYKTPYSASAQVAMFASSIFHGRVWPKLGTLLLVKEEVGMPVCTTGSDAKEWAQAAASNLLFVFVTGATDDDLDCGRAVVLTARPDPDGTGGILFTVREMDERERTAWKTAWMVLPPPTPSPRAGSAVAPDDGPAMQRRIHALYASKEAWFAGSLSSEKGVVRERVVGDGTGKSSTGSQVSLEARADE